jgi:nuclear receptor coactivator 2
LLNDKSDDDDSNSKQHNSELLKRLQNPTKDEKEMNNNADLDNEALKQRLRFQGGPGSLEINSRKRASDESDDASSGAPLARLSKLQEKNKMLASLLAVPCRPINPNTSNLPTVRQMPDIPTQHKQQQMASPVGSMGGEAKTPTTPNPNIPNNKNLNNNSVTKNNNLKNQPQKFRQQNVGRQQSMPAGNVLKQMGESIYISQLQSHQQQQQMVAMSRANVVNSQSSFDGSDSQGYVSSSPAITLAPASSSTLLQPSDSVIDPELNDILDNLFEEGSYSEEPSMNYMQNVNNSVNNNAQLKQQEEMAQINKIQQSLMECEDEANFSSGSPPAYPLHAIAQNARALQQAFSQPPPGYNQRNIRMPQMSINTSNNNLVTNSNAAAVAQATNSQKATPNAMLIERIRMQQQQQQQQIIMEQKQRLLQQQQNQSIVVTAGADQICELNF